VKDLIIGKTYEICKQVLSAKYPKELELLDMIWPQAKKILNKVIAKDPSKWATNLYLNEKSLGLAFTDPVVMKSAIKHLMLITPPILANLITSGISNPDDVKEVVLTGLKTYGDMLFTPIPLLRHLERTLPEMLINIPEELAELYKCWKVFPDKEGKKIVMKRDPITVKDARDLYLKPSEYVMVLNMLNPRLPILYLDGEKSTVRPKAVQILAFLLKRPGEACTYEEIVEGVWGELIEVLPLSKGDKYIHNIEKTINVSLKKVSPLLKNNILPAKRGYKVKEGFLAYCIIERQ
jgi:hypothetical protein